MKKIVAIVMMCMMYACSFEASWWSSFTNSCSTIASSILSRKVEIKGVKAPVAGIVAGATILCGLGYAGYRYYQSWKARQIKLHRNLATVFDGCDRGFAPQPYAQSLVCPVISPGVMQEMPNGLFVAPSLQQVFDTVNAPWNKAFEGGMEEAKGSDILKPEGCADMNWLEVQSLGESTYCGYHALFAAQQMLRAYDAVVEKKYDEVHEAFDALTRLRPYMRSLQKWIPLVKGKRETLEQDVSYCSWLTSDEFNGNDTAGFAGLVTQVDAARIIACDSLNVVFDADGADALKFLQRRRDFAAVENEVMSIILPATALNQGLDSTLNTHWVNFTVMKLQGQIKIFFADSLNEQQHLSADIRDKIYKKLTTIFSMTVGDLDKLERDIVSHKIDVVVKPIESDVKKIYPNEAAVYEFAGYLQTEPMELYEFEKFDAMNQIYLFEPGVGYYEAHFSEVMKIELKRFLKSDSTPVRKMREAIEPGGWLHGDFVANRNSYEVVLPMVFGDRAAMNPRSRLIVIWRNKLIENSFFFVVDNAQDSDEAAQGFCRKYHDKHFVINGVDRQLPADKIAILLDLYDRIIGEQAFVEIQGENKRFAELSWTPRLYASALHLVTQTAIYLSSNSERAEELRLPVGHLFNALRAKKNEYIDADEDIQKHKELCRDALWSLCHQAGMAPSGAGAPAGEGGVNRNYAEWLRAIQEDIIGVVKR